ncbi:hypothetical protein AC578_6951 [Pseudocercospora eumusae]|uniref:Uncharacterized protein n=1 Tax=Pseudocercospora eumusae TaxID=321146 RepID=A0A139H9E4_9PEZI|nr:hypothetical protein AC578_6951 [Pseudocercospora eumusae]
MALALSKLRASTPTTSCLLSSLDNDPTDIKDTNSSSSSPTSSSGTTAATPITDQATTLAALADQRQPAPVFKQGAPRNPPFCIATPLWHLLADPNEPLAIDIESQNRIKDGIRSHRLTAPRSGP